MPQIENPRQIVRWHPPPRAAATNTAPARPSPVAAHPAEAAQAAGHRFSWRRASAGAAMTAAPVSLRDRLASVLPTCRGACRPGEAAGPR